MRTQGILIAIFTVFVTALVLITLQSYNVGKDESVGNSIREVMASAKEGTKELGEEIRDEIDDQTTSK